MSMNKNEPQSKTVIDTAKREELDPDFVPDLVDRMFDYLVELVPEIQRTESGLERVQAALRKEFAGQEVYIPARSSVSKAEERRAVLQLWNGRNATTIARTLGISRATVYRYLKQPG